MADPGTSLTATHGGFDTAALLRAIFTPQVPYSEWAARRRDGAELDTSKIEDAIRWAEAGIMFPVGDMIRETLALNPAATSFLGRAFTPIAMADWDVTQAEGDGLDEADAKRIANDVRAMLRGIRGFRQAIMHLAWGFSDGRAALEKEMVRTTSARPVGVSTRTVVTRLNRIEPQRLSFDDARRLIVVNRWGNSGRFIKQGPALDDIPGKFVQIMPSVFGDLQEREGLAIRFLFWLLFDRFQWRHRLMVMEKMGGPIGVLEQDLQNTMGTFKLPRDLGGEGGSPGDDAKSLDAALVAARAAMDRFGIFIGRPGEKFRFDWPPPEAHSLFSEGSDQILRHLEMLALHAALSSASTEQTRAGLVVLRTDQEILLDFRGALVAEAIQKDLVEPFVEMNYGPDALVYAPMFQLRTTPIRDRGAEVDRILKTAAAVPVGAGVLYEASGARPPNPGELVIKPPAPAGPFGEGGAPGSGAAPAMPEEQSNDGQDAIGALRDLGEDADVDDQTDAADEEAGQVGAHLARWFADPGRKVMPATVHGSPEALVEAGTREGVRSTSQWADELVDAAGGDDPARIYRNLAARAQTLNVEPFTRALERRLVHTLMLGALDADHEAVNDVEIKPATFDRMAFDGGVHDFTTLPFQEAIKAFSEKKVMSRRQFDRLAADAKKKAFTVAGLTTQRMLETAHDELRKAMIPGADLRDFSKKLGERFDAAGWTRLNPSHVENVFRTNVMGAYGDGRRAQMTQPHVMAARPYWQILGVDDARTRKTHAAAHGKVLPANDPFFQNSGPPFGWACRCRIISRSKKDLDRLGLTPTFGAALKGLPDPGWNADAIAPPASWEVQDGPPPAAKAAPPPKPAPVTPLEDLEVRDLPKPALPPEGPKAYLEHQEREFAKIEPQERKAIVGFTNGYDWAIREVDKDKTDAEIIAGIETHRATNTDKRYGDTPTEHLARAKELHADLYKGLGKMAPVSERVVYRGLKGLDRETFDAIRSSGHVEIGAVSSTSWNISVARGFADLGYEEAGTHSVLFELKTRSAHAIEAVSDFEKERELLLKKGVRFRVTKVYRPTESPDAAVVIEAEEL